MNAFFKNLVLFFLNIPYAIDPTCTSLHKHTKLQSGIKQPMCHVQPLLWVTHQKLRSSLFFKDSVDPVTFLSLELKYVTRYVMSPLASVHLRDGHFSDTWYKNKFLKVVCLAKSSNIESAKIVVITLLQRPVFAAAGSNSNHYFQLFGQTKSLPAPDTFCQLMVTTHQHGQRLDNHSLCLLLARAAWSFLSLGNFRVTSRGSRGHRGLIQGCPHLSCECTPQISKYQLSRAFPSSSQPS